MPGIDPSIIVHRLNVSPSFPPIRQKKRVFTLERDQAITEEVRKLQEASFLREVYYPDWLANVVMVKKASRKWRMCLDFTDLNKARPKDVRRRFTNCIKNFVDSVRMQLHPFLLQYCFTSSLFNFF